MKEFLWHLLAKLLSRPAIAYWLIERAKKTPWYPVEGIMDRFWLFNPYSEYLGPEGEEVKNNKFLSWLPSIRIHHIIGPDLDPDMHDHPWDCRTIILRGWYVDKRLNPEFESMLPETAENCEVEAHLNCPGMTTRFRLGDYHKIVSVYNHHMGLDEEVGAWTLFITWKYQGPWGFMVEGKKMLSREYFKYRSQWRS